MEDSPSGLWRTLGKRVGVTASRVRISYPPRLDPRNVGKSTILGVLIFPIESPHRVATGDMLMAWHSAGKRAKGLSTKQCTTTVRCSAPHGGKTAKNTAHTA